MCPNATADLPAVAGKVRRDVRLILGQADGPFACEICGAETFDVWVSQEIADMPTDTSRRHAERIYAAIRHGMNRCRNHEPNVSLTLDRDERS